MKKTLRTIVAIVLTLAIALSLAACSKGGANATTQPKDTSPAESKAPAEKVSQGVTDSEILIGCTMGSTGSYAFIGVPIVDTLKGVFERINAKGGIRGRKIRLIHYDDQYDSAIGKTLIEKLVEEDKVFALNCLGGNIVAPCLDYLKEKGIPVVNITSGLDVIYEDYNPDSRIFPVQPSGTTDGRHLLARVLHESLFGPNKDQKLPSDAKIGVFVSNAESSLNTLNGIMQQAELEGVTDRLVVETVSANTYSNAIQKMKSEGVQVLICTLIDSKGVIAAMDDAGWEVPYVGAYGTSTPQSYSPDTYKPGRPIYATTWADYSTPEAKAMLADLDDALTYNKDLSAETLEAYKNNLYARAGYAAAITLAIGLERLDKSGLDLTWENLAKCMEEAPFELGAIGYFNYANGARLGVTKLSFTEYVVEESNGEKMGVMLSTRSFESLEEIMAK